jgi:hypothetical protein
MERGAEGQVLSMVGVRQPDASVKKLKHKFNWVANTDDVLEGTVSFQERGGSCIRGHDNKGGRSGRRPPQPLTHLACHLSHSLLSIFQCLSVIVPLPPHIIRLGGGIRPFGYQGQARRGRKLHRLPEPPERWDHAGAARARHPVPQGLEQAFPVTTNHCHSFRRAHHPQPAPGLTPGFFRTLPRVCGVWVVCHRRARSFSSCAVAFSAWTRRLRPPPAPTWCSSQTGKRSPCPPCLPPCPTTKNAAKTPRNNHG